MLSRESSTVRLAHFSDIHLTAPARWRLGDLLSKRLSSWANLRFLGRGYRFRHASTVVATLIADARQRQIDRLVFSGDATALGFGEEEALAASLLHVNELPGLAVPGNHDYCTRRAMVSGEFERYFAPWLVGERIGSDIYPFAQRVGSVWLVGVCSSTANRLPSDASGLVGRAQLERLELLLARLGGGPRILVTHYPVALADGSAENRFHLLRDLADLVAVATRGGISLWLHGHRHQAYHHPAGTVTPFPVICSGSATQTGLWTYSEYTITGNHLLACRRMYQLEQGCFRDVQTFELELPCPQSLGVA